MRQNVLAILAAALVGTGLIAYSRQIHTHRRLPRQEEPITLSQPSSPETRASDERVRAKRQIARRMITEQIPLLEAAEMFRQANGEEGMKNLRLGILGRSVREKLCRQVIDYVLMSEGDSQRAGQPMPDTPVADTLQAELNRLIAAGELPPEPGME